jgi:Flp pilus assembly protein TadG
MSIQTGKQVRKASHWAICRGFIADCRGGSATEFALVVPVLALLLFAIIQFGIIFNHYIVLANGVSAGARELSVSRGSATAYTSAVSALNNAAPTLTPFTGSCTAGSTQCVTVTVAGTACTTDADCAAAFKEGQTAQVSAKYPCNINFMGISVSPCSLTSSAAEYIQ